MIEKVINWRDGRAATPRAANIGIDVLRALVKFGIQRGLLRINVAETIGKLYVNGQQAEIIWTDKDLAEFAKAAGAVDQHINDTVQLASVTGLRREDLARLTWAAVGEFAIVKKASRGRQRFATVPRIPELNAVLDRLRMRHREQGVDTVLVTPPVGLGTSIHLAGRSREWPGRPTSSIPNRTKLEGRPWSAASTSMTCAAPSRHALSPPPI